MGNRWVVPDIHGCLNTLKSLIENRINLSKSDAIYFLGDYIDRGPDSKGVIDYIMSLQNAGYEIHCLRGNHEDYCLRAWEADKKRFMFRSNIEKDWRKNGASSTLDSFGVKRPRDIDEKYINWIKKTEYYIELDDCILVHAGMNFNISNPFEDTSSMMWIRNFKVDPNKVGGKKVIHGHVPVEMSLIDLFVQSEGYNFLALDNGIYYKNKDGFGNLLAYNLDTKEIAIQYNIDLEF
ncbi:MAG: serine/threonine protein phosphatase [Bacteroidales bacterium]|nr:serine/threonine protein phosphatase [Lentimicrobiaceae bacterium]MBQ2852229.1 serine/threonine protein phosphatase [Bacteroidales bacterium]